MRIYLCILSFLFTFLSVTGPSHTLPQSEKRYGGTFKWGIYHKPSIINPILTTQTVSAALVQLIFNGLVRINSNGEIEPDLAQSWDISNDGLVYIFHLRKGVRFHDGKECSAWDVKFTYDTMIDARVNSPFKESLQIVAAFEAVDKYTFKVVLKKPSVSFLYRMDRYIIPRHILEGKDLPKSDFNFYPVGTGPFKFESWAKDGQITLWYNSDYYEGLPYLDKIEVKTYSNSQDVWAALMRGDVDCVEFIGRKDYEVVKNDDSFKTYAVLADGYYALVYNLNDPLLANQRIREAIAYAVDRKSLIERVAGGYGKECYGPFYPGSLGFNPQVLPFEYNPQKAQKLLAEAGWQDMDNDGILEKNAEKLELNVLVDSRNKIYETIVKALRQQLQEVGIKINVHLYNDDSMLTKEFLEQEKFQARLMLLPAGLDPDQESEVWASIDGERMNTLWVYKNEEVDKLFALGGITQDRQKRKEIYQRIHRIIYQEQSVCFLYFPFDFHAISAQFENTDEYFTVNMPNYTIKDFFIRSTAMPIKERQK